jgi:hypothetical protein
MRKVQQIMGMPISIDIPDCDAAAVFDAAFGRLRQIDDKFSTYKPSSEVSRFAAGKIAEEDLSDELKQVIKACRKAEAQTDGYFSAWAKAPSISHLDAVQGSKEEQAKRIKHTVSAVTDAADAAMRQKSASAAGSAGRQWQALRGLCNGPGKLAQAMGIFDTSLSGKILNKSSILLEAGQPVEPSDMISAPRIGITKAVEQPWRFYIKNNPYVSKL